MCSPALQRAVQIIATSSWSIPTEITESRNSKGLSGKIFKVKTNLKLNLGNKQKGFLEDRIGRTVVQDKHHRH